MPAEALLVAQPGDPDDHRVGVLAVGEEAQRRRLAAQLVLGIVDVSEELDLGDRQQAVMGCADAEAEDALLVEQSVDHPTGSEPLVQLRGDVVDAALRPDILAGDDDVPVRQHQVGERPAQEPCHMLRLVHHRRVAGEQRLAVFARRRVGYPETAFRRHQTLHHGRAGGELGPSDRLLANPGQGRLDLVVAVEDLGLGHDALLDQQGGAVEQGIALLVFLDLRLGAVSRLNVGAGMAV
jgi:hypothetical protein